MEPKKFRQTMAQFVTGVTVVTAGRSHDTTGIHGMTCNSFSSVSSQDATISVCLTRDTRTERLIRELGEFAVNVLSAEQQEVADRFAGRHKEFDHQRFEGIAWDPGDQHAAPLLQGAKARLQCRVLQQVDAGDHTLFVARVLHASFHEDATPLVFYNSAYRDLQA